MAHMESIQIELPTWTFRRPAGMHGLSGLGIRTRGKLRNPRAMADYGRVSDANDSMAGNFEKLWRSVAIVRAYPLDSKHRSVPTVDTKHPA